MNNDITYLLESWDYQPGQVMVRRFKNKDGVEKIQLRVDLGILQMNAEAVGILKGLSGVDGISLPSVGSEGQPDMEASRREPVNVRLHYMVGNHDWFYHLPGANYDALRQVLVAW